jgi:hypothetical protein
MISGTLTQEHHLHALRLHRRKTVKVLVGVLLACAVIGVVALATDHLFSGLILVCGGVGGAISAFAQSRLTLPRQVAKIHRQQASLHAHYTYSWDEEWLSVASEHVQAKRRWSDYAKVRENEEVLLLYHSDVMFEVLPKAWFNGQAQMDEFRRLASRAAG